MNGIAVQVGIEILVHKDNPEDKVYRAIVMCVRLQDNKVIDSMVGPVRQTQAEAEADVLSVGATVQENAKRLGMDCDTHQLAPLPSEEAARAKVPSVPTEVDAFDQDDPEDFKVPNRTVH